MITTTFAQVVDSTYIAASPKEGFNSILHFFNQRVKLNYSERKSLEEQTLTIELKIDATGQVTEVGILGTRMASVIEKVQTVCLDLPTFNPATYNGQPVDGNYFFTISYQDDINYIFTTPSYQKLTLDDFELLEEGDFEVSIYFSGMTNSHFGNINRHLGWGGGFSAGVLLGTPRFSAGFDMSIYGNGLQQPFTINDTRPQNDAPPSLFLGAVVARELKSWENSALSMQMNLSMVVLNVITTEDPTVIEPVQFWGFSPGVRANYAFTIGKPRFVWYYGSPALFRNTIQVHAGFYPQLMKETQANGINFDIGLGYRMAFTEIANFKLKE